jgi:hypothetical protein
LGEFKARVLQVDDHLGGRTVTELCPHDPQRSVNVL